MNHAEVVCEFGGLVAEFAENGFTLVSDYQTGAGRFFFVHAISKTDAWGCGARLFVCSSIEELKAWLSGYKQSKAFQVKMTEAK